MVMKKITSGLFCALLVHDSQVNSLELSESKKQAASSDQAMS